MPRRITTLLLAAVAALTTVFVGALPAAAITGGTVDSTNRYSNVGLIAFYDSTGRFRCSATLVSPTVLLTAAHCTDGTVGKTIVTFEWFVDDAPPSNLPRAADDDGDGTSQTGYTGPYRATTRVPPTPTRSTPASRT